MMLVSITVKYYCTVCSRTWKLEKPLILNFSKNGAVLDIFEHVQCSNVFKLSLTYVTIIKLFNTGVSTGIWHRWLP